MPIDIIGRLVDRIMNKTNLRQFSRYSDSLEAISEGVITYMGYTDTAGAASGLTIVDTPLAAMADYSGQLVKVLDGTAAGQVKTIVTHVGNTLLVDTPFAVQIAANIAYVIISRLAAGGATHGDIDFLEGFPYINEAWEPANLDLNLWTPTHPATNNIVVVENTAPNVGYSVVMFDVEDAETARLVGRAGVNRWRVNPTLMGTNHAVKQFLMEWEIYFNDIANIDDAAMFMGLVTNPASTRVTNDIIGFGVTLPPAWSIDTITDRGGAQVLIGTAVPATFEDTRVKLRILIDEDNIYFYINEVLAATHPVAGGSLPDQLMYPCFYMPSAGLGASTFEYYLGAVRIGYVDIP